MTNNITLKPKKIIALVMALIMVMSLLPISAMAAGTPNQIVSGRTAGEVVSGSTNVSAQYYDGTGGAAGESNYAVSISKSITDQAGGTRLPENQFDITLEVNTTATETEIQRPVDAAVVIIIDDSSSMSKDDQAAAKAAAKSFIDKFAASAGDSGGKRYVSIVSFGTMAKVIAINGNNVPWLDVNTAFGMNISKGRIDSINSRQAGTFMQGGLMLARNLYNMDNFSGELKTSLEAVPAKNRFVVLLTDGNPNVRITDPSYTGLGNVGYTGGSNWSNAGSGSKYTTSNKESGFRASRIPTASMAGTVKNLATVYTIAYNTGGIAAVDDLTPSEWLAANVASLPANAFTSSQGAEALNLKFDSIAESIKYSVTPWMLTDPMTAGVAFSGDTTGEALSFADSTLKWDLTKTSPAGSTTTEKNDVTRTVYTYKYTYRVTLDNLAYDFTSATPTNGETTLTYRTGEDQTVYTVNFTVPTVKSFAAPFSFTKTNGSTGDALSGVNFALYADGDMSAPYRTATSAVGTGLVDFGSLPSGHVYTLVETSSIEGFRKDNGTHTITVSYGALSINSSNGALTQDGGKYVFTNSPDTFKVTVNYYVDGNVIVRTVEQNGCLDESAYAWAINGADVTDSISYDSSNYYLDSGINNDTGAQIFAAAEKAALEGSIDGKDVVIDLYYSKLALPNVPLTKQINKLSDATYPDEYTFNFALYLANGTKVTNDLSFTQDEIGTAKNFVWNLPDSVSVADLRNAELYLQESESGSWTSSAMGTPVLYGTLDRLVGFNPAADYADGSVTNTYNQQRLAPVITLHKFFASEEEVELLPEFDGAVISCGLEESEETDATIERTWVTCDAADCEDPDHSWNDDEDSHGYWVEQEIPGNPGHTHDDSCYAYEFTFELYSADGGKLGEKTVRISYERMLELLADPSDCFEVIFDALSTDVLPEPGSGDLLSVTIKESSNNYGWIAASDATGIVIDPYGKVSYAEGAANAAMTNVFDGFKIPSFSFTKNVIDGRSLTGATAADYSGTFSFELYDNGVLVDVYDADGNIAGNPITLDVVNGVGSYTVYLPNYIGTAATLTLVEVAPENAIEGMTYDVSEFTVSISADEATVTEAIVFKNTLLTPETPVATINKKVNTDSVVETFNFTWDYVWAEGAEGEDGNGSGSITVNDAYAPISIDLPQNFTGTLTITEDTSNVVENWVYDSNNVRIVEYVLGRLTGDNATGDVVFTNNYYVPGIELTKVAGAADIVLYESVDFTITVVNNGAENLKNVVITDAMFNDTVKVFKPGAAEGDANSELEADTDYVLDLENGTVTLTGELGQGEKVFIRYTVTPEGTGAVENVATVTGERTITMGEGVTDEKEVIVNVTKYASQLTVSKYVAEYVQGAAEDSVFDTLDSISNWLTGVGEDQMLRFAEAGHRAAFKVTIANKGDGILNVTNITDSFAGTDLKDATFYYEGVSYAGLDALVEVLGGVNLYGGDGEIVFYFISDALTHRGTFTNTVNVTAIDSYEDEHAGSDSASVVLNWTEGGGGYDDGGGYERETITTPPEIIEEPEIPLAYLPVEPEEIIDEEVPLGELPQTGDSSHNIPLMAFLLSALGLGALLKGKGREEEAE